MDKEKLITKIDEEMRKWQEYYQHTELHIYAMITSCFRAGAQFVEDESKKVNKMEIFNIIDEYLATIDSDDECLDTIFNTIMNTFIEISAPFLQELMDGGNASNATLAKLTVIEALADIENELVARQRINDESLISMRTLQWVKNIINEDNKNEA